MAIGNGEPPYWPTKKERVRMWDTITVNWDSETKGNGYVRTKLLVSIDDDVCLFVGGWEYTRCVCVCVCVCVCNARLIAYAHRCCRKQLLWIISYLKIGLSAQVLIIIFVN